MQGYDWYTLGAQKGIIQPPYCVFDRGRWWRTLPLGGPVEYGPYLDQETLAALRALPKLQYGARRCLDYLNCNNKHFRDLPIWKATNRRRADESKHNQHVSTF